MSSFGNITNNNDGSKNLSVGFEKENGANTTTGSLFVNNQRDYDPHTNQPNPSYGVAGGNLNFHHAGNPSTTGSVTLQHIPKMGNQASLAAGIGAGSDTHRVGVDAFAAHTMPHHHPNFTTVGANVNAQAGRVGAHAGIAHTPMFRQTEHSVGAGLNLHKSPTSSVDVNIGSSRIVTPHHRGDWNHGINFGVKKHF